MKTEVFFWESGMHVRPMRFSILFTPTDSSDKTQMMCSTILNTAVLVYIQIQY